MINWVIGTQLVRLLVERAGSRSGWLAQGNQVEREMGLEPTTSTLA